MKISLGKTKINILDITLIMILVFSVAGAFIRDNKDELSAIGKDSSYAVITVVADDSEYILYNNVKKGDKLDVSDSGRQFGEVVSVVRKYAKAYEHNEDHTLQEAFSSEKPQVVIRIKTKYKNTDKGKLTSSGVYVTPGTDLMLESKGLSIDCNVTSIE